MKSIKDYINECDFTTPLNTPGMGNVILPVNDVNGSEPIIVLKQKRKLKKRKNKKHEINN